MKVSSKKESISLKDFKTVSIPRDGNCLYSAISYALFGSVTGANALRNIVSRYVRDNWFSFKPFLPGQTVEEYYAYHSRSGTFAPQVDLFTASLALKVEIVLYLPYKIMTFAGPEAPTWGPVYLLFEPPAAGDTSSASGPKAGAAGRWRGARTQGPRPERPGSRRQLATNTRRATRLARTRMSSLPLRQRGLRGTGGSAAGQSAEQLSGQNVWHTHATLEYSDCESRM